MTSILINKQSYSLCRIASESHRNRPEWNDSVSLSEMNRRPSYAATETSIVIWGRSVNSGRSAQSIAAPEGAAIDYI